MNLENAIRKILSEWNIESKKPFRDNQLAQFIREDFTQLVTNITQTVSRTFILKASAGAGNWASVPWLSILDPKITTTTQDGIYPVYLFCADGSGVYLSLNQGTTNPKNFLGKKRSENRALGIVKHCRSNINHLSEWNGSSLHLKTETELGKSYETPSIGSRYYSSNSIPTNTDLVQDLIELLGIYGEVSKLWPAISDYKIFSETTQFDNQLFEKTKSKESSQNMKNDFNVMEFMVCLKKSNIKHHPTLPIRFTSSILSKPFVILTGLAGSGKTKLAEAFSKWIVEDEQTQICMVAVGADWTNREPLLGYPNALTSNEYVMPESGVLELLLAAQDNPELPYFLILDEMNMSHVERYFADFLSAMESESHEIKLHSNTQGLKSSAGLEIPRTVKLTPNLFIIGTVNIDETTYMFSPKVLDRAQVIEFRVSENEMADFLKESRPIIMEELCGKGSSMGPDLVSLAMSAKHKREQDLSVLQAFFTDLQNIGAEFGYRTVAEISTFISVCSELNQTFEHKMSSNEIMDAAIIQKLLPKIHGSRNKIEKILLLLESKCQDRYPLSLEKLERMHKRVISDGFTSFAEA